MKISSQSSIKMSKHLKALNFRINKSNSTRRNSHIFTEFTELTVFHIHYKLSYRLLLSSSFNQLKSEQAYSYLSTFTHQFRLVSFLELSISFNYYKLHYIHKIKLTKTDEKHTMNQVNKNKNV